MSSRSPNTLVLFAGVSRRTPTTCDLLKAGRLGAKSAMSSLSRCAEGIIAESTAAATKRLGGRALELIPSSRPGRFGLRRIPWRKARRKAKVPPPSVLAMIEMARSVIQRLAKGAQITKRSQLRGLHPRELA